jgi:hypothetical protein
MSDHLELDTVIRLAREAFLPYTCISQINPGDDNVRLNVVGSDGNEVLSIPNLSPAQYSDPLRLSGVLQQARLDLTHKGCNLQPWEMPYITDARYIPETPPIY